MTLFEAAVFYDKLDPKSTGSIVRAHFLSSVGGFSHGKHPAMRPTVAVPDALRKFPCLEESTTIVRKRQTIKQDDLKLNEDGSYTIVFRGKKGMPILGFKLQESDRKRDPPVVDTSGYEVIESPGPDKSGAIVGYPLPGDSITSVT